MPAGDPTADVQPWLSASVQEPLARALGYIRPGLDTELGQLRQSRAIERACSERGIELADLLADETANADTAGPALRHALERIVAGDASALVVARLDSLAGSAAGVGTMMAWFLRNEARFIAVDLELDTATPGGAVAAGALRAAGGLERRMLQERTRRGLEAARHRGTRAGRPAVADRPDLRERIRALRTAGRTLQAIADELNAESVPTLRGGAEWRPSSVHTAAGYRRPDRGRGPDGLPGNTLTTRTDALEPG